MGGPSGGDVSNANAGIPASSRKVVQSLKEIVNCSDLEIYAMLVECDMDPDETVNRLLSQDTFHEVKSKRDKKKETKDPVDSWVCSVSRRGPRSSGTDSYNTPRGDGNRFNSNETGNFQGISAKRRENGTRNHQTGSSSTPGVLGRQPPSISDPPTSHKVMKAPTGSSDAVTSSSLPSPAYQSVWVSAKPGQRTMAEIVKMGRPLHWKNVALPRSLETQESGSKAPLKDEWPSIETQDVSYPSSSLLKPSAESKMSTDKFSESQHKMDETHLDDECHETKTNSIASPLDGDQVPPASVSSRNLLDDDSIDSSPYDSENNKAERHAFEGNGGENISASVATVFQQLAIENEKDHEALPKEDKPAVIIPNHLQMHTPECSHLMFGSFGSGIGSGQASGLNDNLEETQETEDNSSFRHPHTDFYAEEGEQLRKAATDEQTSYQIDSTSRNYHDSLDSETEAAQCEPPQEDQQYKFSSSADYGFENSQQLDPPPGTNPQMQILYTDVMQQGYTSSLPNSLLSSGVQDAREPDPHYSPFSTKYNCATPSLNGPTISMAEALRAANMSPQNAMLEVGQQAAAHAQHHALNPYSHQHGMPLGHYGNLISYPYVPQSYNPYMPSAFQQAFPAANHQSLAVMLPQYKTQSTVAPTALPSAYGFGIGGGAASSNNFPLNPASAANSYEDVLSSQFKDSNHLVSSLQLQNENSPAWHQGQQPNSRVIPRSGYYNFPGHHNQQPPGFRQTQQLQQQPSQQQQQQHFGGHGYVTPYHSQAAMSLDHLHLQHHQQQQNAQDASKQNQQQLWHNNY